MKKFVLMLALAMASLFSQAQTLTAQGWCNGHYYYSVSGLTGSIKIKLDGSGNIWGNGRTDTTYIVSGTFVLAIPQPNKNNTLEFTFTSQGVSFTTGTNAGGPCTVTPIKLVSWTAIPDTRDSTLIRFSWTVSMEQDVNYYNIQGSSDGVNYETLQTVTSIVGGNTNNLTAYTGYQFYDPLVTAVIQAGFGLMGSLLIIGLIAGFVSKKHRTIGIVCAIGLVIGLVSCTKYVNNVEQKVRKYKYFRLMEVDHDNTTLPTYSQVVHI